MWYGPTERRTLFLQGDYLASGINPTVPVGITELWLCSVSAAVLNEKLLSFYFIIILKLIGHNLINMWSKEKSIKHTTSPGVISSDKAHFCMFVNISYCTETQNHAVHANQNTEPAVSLVVWEFGCNESDVNNFNKNYILKYFNNEFISAGIIPSLSVFLYTSFLLRFSLTASICILYFLAETVSWACDFIVQFTSIAI